jgi:hypothetical protein
MLNIRLVRSPLPPEQYDAILADYNRLTGADIPWTEFLRWVRDGPEGPAWHALLETDEGRIIGHTSVLPLRAGLREVYMTAAMSEYSYVHEDFRKIKIRGYENVSRPTFIILLDTLFKHCQKEGWGPIFASTNEKNQIFTRKVGLRPAEFPLRECLLVLKPRNAARYTPNMSRKQALALYAVGLAQSSLWSVMRLLRGSERNIRELAIGSESLCPETDRLTFYEERESLRWRYLADQYVLLTIKDQPRDYIIAKRGKSDRYLRVCQYRLSSAGSIGALIRTLVARARADDAMGIRWAVYADGELSKLMIQKLRMQGFLCAQRTRIVMVHKDFPEFLHPSMWRMSDAHFCFDP